MTTSLLRPLGLLIGGLLLGIPASAAPPVINSFKADDSTLYYGALPSFEWNITGASSAFITPGLPSLTPLPVGNGTVAAVPGRSIVISRGSTWTYSDTGADLGPSNQPYIPTAWFHPDYDDSAWLSGPAELGYGDAPVTTVSYGAVATQKHITTYFRREFSITADQISKLAALFLELERDDGAIVYLNGTKIARMQIPADPVNFDTVAAGDTGGGEESFYFRVAVDKGLLLPGNNCLAVEVHQTSQTSSDLSFDLELAGISASDTVTLVDQRSTWKYLDDGSDGNAGAIPWNGTAFSDAAWTAGAAPLGFTTANATTLVEYGTDPALKPVTAYFRKKFNVADKSLINSLHLRYFIDDGLVVYINGKEVHRKYLPAAPASITPATAASAAHNTNASFNSYEPALPGEDLSAFIAELNNGENVIAVEVHQAARNSSDLYFNLTLAADTGTLVPGWSTWQYFENLTNTGLGNSDQANTPAAWFNLAFNDTAWKTGRALFAYNSGTAPALQGVSTVLSPGSGELDGRTIAYYFRRNFAVTADQLSALDSVTIQVTRDDAAAVYINGFEVARDTILPAQALEDPLGYTTLASAATNGTVSFTIPKASAHLLEGDNLIAVEVHQTAANSTDVLFDLAMFGNVSGTSRSYTLSATNADGTTTQTLTLPLAALPATSSDPVALMQSEDSTAATIDWNTPELWSDGALPDPGKAVTVYGNFARYLRTPAVASPVWPGGPLTIRGFRARLALHQSANTVATVADLILDHGQLQSGIAGTAAIADPATPAVPAVRRIEGNLTVNTSGILNPGAADAILDIGSAISGTGTLIVTGSAGVAAVQISSDNSATFSGPIVVQRAIGGVVRGKLYTGHAKALGSNNTVTVEEGARLEPTTAAPDALTTNLVLLGTTSRFTLTLGSSFKSVTVNGTPLADGTYRYSDIPAALQANFADNGGTLSVNVSNPDGDGDGIPDAWEIGFFGSTQPGAADDNDGDGSTNLTEYLAGTSPVNRSDVFLITSVTPNLNRTAFTVAWSAKSGRNYQVRFSDNLTTWTPVTVSLTNAPADGTLTWVDNGSETGGLPASGHRFYEVMVLP